MEVADNIASYIFPITNILSDPSCRIIKPIIIDYNFIEVMSGYFFNIGKKLFEKNPTTLVGSPRAFVLYEYTGTVPYPKPFIEGEEQLFVWCCIYLFS